MPNNITYLLGAGASAEALPILDEMKGSINDLIRRLSNFFPENLNSEAFGSLPIAIQERIPILKAITTDFNWVLEQAKSHKTVDALARFFYLTDDIASLDRLKKSLLVYFTISQLCRITSNPVIRTERPPQPLIDIRYSSFITSNTVKREGGMIFKENIKIITWNYDLQLELSLKRYRNRSIHQIKEEFQIFPNHNSFDLPDGNLINHSSFGMVKLNGNAFWDNHSEAGEQCKTTLFDKYFDYNDSWNFLSDLLFQYEWLHANGEKHLKETLRYFNFAWESDPLFLGKHTGHNNNLNEAIKIAQRTDVLVVIGYSFPEFNREIDEKIFDSMSRLTKIYIQDKYPNKIKAEMENAFRRFQERIYIGGPPEITFDLSADFKQQFKVPFELNR